MFCISLKILPNADPLTTPVYAPLASNLINLETLPRRIMLFVNRSGAVSQFSRKKREIKFTRSAKRDSQFAFGVVLISAIAHGTKGEYFGLSRELQLTCGVWCCEVLDHGGCAYCRVDNELTCEKRSGTSLGVGVGSLYDVGLLIWESNGIGAAG